jgi:uncharacterized protein YndB with AHSA1/START domain
MEKYTIEYVFSKVSLAILWKCVSTTDGLSSWFADRVDRDGKDFTFCWDGHEQQARLLRRSDEELIRFHWVDEPADTYFEFAIHHEALTRDVTLTITDFAEEGETEDAIRLWNSQIDTLRRCAGM